jgi:hypothetical protein
VVEGFIEPSDMESRGLVVFRRFFTLAGFSSRGCDLE